MTTVPTRFASVILCFAELFRQLSAKVISEQPCPTRFIGEDASGVQGFTFLASTVNVVLGDGTQ